MLTETDNKHFSEKLYYADNIPDGVNPCRNGNIAALGWFGTGAFGAAAIGAAPYVLTAVGISLIGWSYYKAGEYFANMVNDLNGMFNSKNFWGYLYGFDCYEQSW